MTARSLQSRWLLVLAMLAAACDGCSRKTAVDPQIRVSPEPGHSTTTFAGPPWGHAWCLRSETVWPPEFTQKYAAGMVRGDDPEQRRCENGARFEGRDGRELAAWVRCGDAEIGAVPWYTSSYWTEKAFDPDLGVDAHAFAQPNRGYQIDAWDRDVPCHVDVAVHGPDAAENESKARALTKDVLGRLTPDTLARPLAELVIDAGWSTPERAREQLQRFAKQASTVARFAPLAAGYPRVIKSEDFPGLGPGKFFVLYAVCGSTKGEQLAHALSSAVPLPPDRGGEGLALGYHRVDGTGLQEACPANVTADPSLMGSSFMFHVLPDGRQLAFGLIQSRDVTAPGETHTRVVAFLYSKEREFLDSTVVESQVPPERDDHGRYASQSHVRYDGCKALLDRRQQRFSFGCDGNWADLKCRKKPASGTTYDFETTPDDKIKVTTSPWETQGEGCRPNEPGTEEETKP